ncbi:MAG: MerR family transcriptional regulator [Hyphomicrobiaceae bacterium]
MAKAADAFRTISEVADDLDIQKHVLRFWEVKFSQIRPMKRGGGRRYYRPEDMELLRGIRQLLHRDGYTIKGVQKILREQGVEAVKERARSEEEKRLAAGATAPTTPKAAPVAPVLTGGRAKVATRRSSARAGSRGSSAADPRNVIEAVIAELINCRDILSSETSATSRAKSQRSTRRLA